MRKYTFRQKIYQYIQHISSLNPVSSSMSNKIEESKRQKRHKIPKSTNQSMYKYYVEKQLWDMSNKSDSGLKTKSNFQSEFIPQYRQYGSLNTDTDYLQDSMNQSLLASESAFNNNFPKFSLENIQNHDLHQESLKINVLQDEILKINNKIEFYLEDTMNLIGYKRNQNERKKFTKNSGRRQKSLDNFAAPQRVYEFCTTSQVSTIGIQTDFPIGTPRFDLKTQEPRKGKVEMNNEDERFSFCQRYPNQSSKSKSEENQLGSPKHSPEKDYCNENKIQILEKKIVIITNKLKLYDSVFQTQDSEIQRLLTKINRFQQKYKQIQNSNQKYQESTKLSLEKIYSKQKQQITQKSQSQGFHPQRSYSPVRVKLFIEENYKIIDELRESEEYLNNQNERMDMLQKENKYLQDELLKVIHQNKVLNNQLDKMKDQSQISKSSQDRMISDPLYSKFSDQFIQVDVQQQILDKQYLENETITELYKQANLQKLKSLNLELECASLKSINNYLHKTIEGRG